MKSVKDLEKDLETGLLLYGEKHQSIASIYNEMANVHFKESEYRKAIDVYKKAEKIYIDLYGGDNEIVVDVNYRITKVLETLASLNSDNEYEAKAYLKKTLLMREKLDKKDEDEEEEPKTLDNKYTSHIDSSDSTLIYNDMAENARLNGKFDEAIPLYLKSIDLRRKKFGNESPALCPVLVNYAEVLKHLEKYEEAQIVLEEAVAINMKVFGKKHENFAEAINNLGQIYRLQGSTDIAESLLIEALQIRRELYGDLHVSVGATLNNLAELYREKSDFQQAISFHQLAIEAFISAVGEEHPGTINAKGNLGITYRRYSKVNQMEGELLLKQAIDFLQTNEYSANHPWLIKFGNEHILNQAKLLSDQGKHEQSVQLYDTVLNKKKLMDQIQFDLTRPISPSQSQDISLISEGKMIGMIGKARNFIKNGKFSSAENILNECIEFPRHILGNNHPFYADVNFLNAEAQFALGNYAVVSGFLIDSLNAKIDAFGPDSIDLVEVLISLANFFRSQAMYEQSETFYNQAMKIVTYVTNNDLQSMGSPIVEHVRQYVAAIVGMADLNRNLGSYDVASEMLQKIPAMCEENLLQDDPIMAECFSSLASLEIVKGDVHGAMSYFNSCLEIRIKNFGRNHHKTASTLLQMGRVEWVMCNFNQAEKLIEESTYILAQIYPEDHPAIAIGCYYKAMLFKSLNRYEDAQSLMMQSLDIRTAKLPSNHPSIAQSHFGIAEIYLERFNLPNSLENYEKSLKMRRSIFTNNNNHSAVAESLFGMAKILFSKTQLTECITHFEEAIEMKQAIMDTLSSTSHIDWVDFNLKYSEALLLVGRLKEATASVGKSGVMTFSIFKKERHFKMAECLYHLAEVSKYLGKYKDAKYQYSLCLAIKNTYLSSIHWDIWKILLGAADNMRMVGYFHDTFEVCNAFEAFYKLRRFDNAEIETYQALSTLFHAKALLDKGKSTMAETMFDNSKSHLKLIFGETSIQSISIDIGIAKCFLAQSKASKADKIFKETLAISRPIFCEKSLIVNDLVCMLNFSKYFQNNKPEEQQIALSNLTDQVLPYCNEELGLSHPYTNHVKGRIGVFMNKLKKDSGRKMVFDSLKFFDKNKQFPFTFDHPWILELGGYEKQASKERLSTSIEELALADWSMPGFDGDLSFGVIPKNIWIDLQNYSADVWGAVYFYGTGKNDVEISDSKPPTPFARIRTPQSGSQRKASTVVVESAANSNIEKAIEEKLIAERKIRDEIEENLLNEINQRKDVEEKLKIESDAKVETEKKLADELEQRKKLEEQTEEMSAMKKALNELMLKMPKSKDLDDVVTPMVSIKRKKILADRDSDNTSETSGDESFMTNMNNKPDMDDNEILNSITDVKIKSEIDASEFLYNRAINLYSNGWYDKAQPLFEESFLIRDKYIQKVTITGDTLFAMAENLSLSLKWSKANEKFKLYLTLRDENAYRGGPLKYAEALMAQGVNFLSEGLTKEADAKFGDVTKLLSAMPDGSSGSFLGELLSNQGMYALMLGKLSDARSMAERSQSILSRAFGANHLKTTYPMFVRAAVYLEMGRSKDSYIYMEQTMAIRSQILGESHPLIADCHLGMGIALMDNGKYEEAKLRITKSIEMRISFFGEEDLRVAEAIHFEAKLNFNLGNYKECINLNNDALTIRKKYFPKDNHPSICESLSALGEVQTVIGNFSQAEEFLNKAINTQLELYTNSDGLLHPKIGETKLKLAILYRVRGNYDLASKHLVDSMMILQKFYGDTHPLYITGKQELANLTRDKGEIESSITMTEEVLNNRREILGDDHPDYAISLLSYAESLKQSKDRWTEAKGVLDQTRSCFRFIFGDKNPHTYFLLCEIYQRNLFLTSIEFSDGELLSPLPDFSKSEDNGPVEEDKNEEDEVGSYSDKKFILPTFNNESFLAHVKELESLILKVRTTFKFVYAIGHPLESYLNGCIALTKIYEHEEKQKFINALPADIKKAFKDEELFQKRVSKKLSSKAPGVDELQNAIVDLNNITLTDEQSWMRKFREVEHKFVFILDDMEVAANTFIEGEALRKEGKYFEAEEKYDIVFMLQINSLGPITASASILVADTLFGKAENSRYVGNLSLSKVLYGQSSSIYRKCEGINSEGVIKCTYGLANLLYTYGLYDEALSLFTRVETYYLRVYGEESLQVGQARTSVAFCHMKLGKYEQGLKLAQGAFDSLLRIVGRESEELVPSYICVACIQSLMSNFTIAREYIDTVENMLQRKNQIDDHFLLADVLQCKIDNLIIEGQWFEANKLVMKLMKYRIKVFGQSANTEIIKSVDRRSAFFDAFDVLTVETKKTVDINGQQDGKGYKVNISGLSEQDIELEKEMSVYSKIEDEFLKSDNDTETSSLPSLIKFTPTINPPVFSYKGIPVFPHASIAECLFTRGKICAALADYSEAKQMLEASLNITSKIYVPKTLKSLAISYEHANLIFTKGSFDESKSIHTSILQQRLQICDEFHPDKSDSLFMLGTIATIMGKYDDSAQILAESLLIRKKVYTEGHWKLAEIYKVLAEVLHGRGLFEESNAYYEKAMTLSRKSLGNQHFVIAELYIGQATNAIELGQYESAMSLVEQAIANQCITLGETHPEVARSLYYKASICRQLGKYLEAKKYLDEVIPSQRDKLGKYHPKTITTLLAMAYNFMDLAKYSTAGHVYERANQLLRKSYGKDHVVVAIGIVGLAENFRLKGMYPRAKELHEQALYMRRKVLGEKHPSVAESIYLLSEINLMNAKFEECMKGFDDALALQRMSLGNVHPHICNTIQGIGKTLLAQGKVMDAKSTQEKALAMKKSIYPADHPSIGESQLLIAQIYRKLGKLDQANALFERCTNTIRDSRGSRHPLVATAIFNSGEIANTIGRYSQAKELFLESLKIRVFNFKDINENHPDLAESYFGLADNLRLTGIYDVIKAPKEEKFSKKRGTGLSKSKSKIIATPIEAIPENSDIAESILSGERIIDFDAKTDNQSQRENMISASSDNVIVEHVSTIKNSDASIQSEEVSAPTVLISDIEHLDVVSMVDEFSIDGLRDGTNIIEQDDLFKALPLYEKCLGHYQACFDNIHPIVLQTKQYIAETYRNLGRFEDAIIILEEILAERRKLLGDHHPDTVASMFVLADVLRSMGKLFADNPSGSADAKSVKKAMSSILSGVTLVDQLNAITDPSNDPNSANNKKLSKSEKSKIDSNGNFLTKLETTTTKKVPIRIRRGYMGYEFPTMKEMTKSDLPQTASQPKKVRNSDAKWLYDSCLNIQKIIFGAGEHPVTAAILFAKGELMRGRKESKEALQYYDQSLSMRRKLFRGTHPSIADCLNSMAEVFRTENKFSQAAPMFEKALEIRMEIYGGRHASIAETKNNIAMLHFVQGAFEEAQHLFEEALYLCEELLGPLHPSTAVSINNLAGLFHTSAKYDLAREMYDRALTIKEKAFGKDHPDVASTLNNIGLLYKAQNNFESALDYYQKAFEIQKNLYGPIHADVATSINNIASLYVSQNKYIEAKDLYKQSLAMRTMIFGLDHPTVAATLNNYGGLLFSMREYDAARELFENSLRIKKKLWGEHHISIAETMNNLGMLLCANGSFKDAIPMLEKSLHIKTLYYGPENPLIATTMFQLAILHHKSNDLDGALDIYHNVLNLRTNLLGSDNKDTKQVKEYIDIVQKDIKRKLEKIRAKSTASRNAIPSAPGGLFNENDILQLEQESDNASLQFDFNRN